MEPKVSKPKSLKIKSKKKKTAKKVAVKKLVVKAAKLARTTRKTRIFVRKAMKAAIKGSAIKKIPERMYKRIDAEIAKNPALLTIVDQAVIAIVNTAIAGPAKVKVPKVPKKKNAKSDAPAELKTKEVTAAAE
jgi:hypothetical protein